MIWSEIYPIMDFKTLNKKYIRSLELESGYTVKCLPCLWLRQQLLCSLHTNLLLVWSDVDENNPKISSSQIESKKLSDLESYRIAKRSSFLNYWNSISKQSIFWYFQWNCINNSSFNLCKPYQILYLLWRSTFYMMPFSMDEMQEF